jgi:hypothetical protein
MINPNAKPSSSKERRSGSRIQDHRRIDFRLIKPQAGEGFTQNFSEEGCCVVLNEELPPGSVIELTFKLPGAEDRRQRVVGKVVWQENFLTGIRFLPRPRKG